jgi:hypothetical protein
MEDCDFIKNSFNFSPALTIKSHETKISHVLYRMNEGPMQAGQKEGKIVYID